MSIFKRSKSKSEPAPENIPVKSTAFKSVRLDILKRPVMSEKATLLHSQNQYVFLVSHSANKKMVKEEIERRYGVRVKAVNMLSGKKSRNKKAVITLKTGHKIEI